MKLWQGSIIWVEIQDKAGRNSKCRPAVVVTPSSDIAPGQSITVVAATGRFSDPPSDREIELPWDRRRHPKTDLTKPCVVVCDWITEISQSQIDDVAGRVPIDKLKAILRQYRRFVGQQD